MCFIQWRNGKQYDGLDSLIDQNNHGYNVEVVEQMFDPEVREPHTYYPLIESVYKDKLIWKAEKDGQYLVRSSYRLCVNTIVDNSHLHKPSGWNEIWKLEVPSKVNNFVWRVCRNCLPTWARLTYRGINCSTTCVVCNHNYEDEIHILFEWPRVVQVWRNGGLLQDVTATLHQGYNATTSIFLLLQRFPKTKVT